MTAARLIELLKTIPPETAILIGTDRGTYHYQEKEFRVEAARVDHWDDSRPRGQRSYYEDVPIALVFDGS